MRVCAWRRSKYRIPLSRGSLLYIRYTADTMAIFILHGEGPRPREVCQAAKAPELVCAGTTAILHRENQRSEAGFLSLPLCLRVFPSLS